jgi:hypothetical protein
MIKIDSGYARLKDGFDRRERLWTGAMIEHKVSGNGVCFMDGGSDVPFRTLSVPIQTQDVGAGLESIRIWKNFGSTLFDKESAVKYKRALSTDTNQWVYDADSASCAFPCDAGTDYLVSVVGETELVRVGVIASELPSEEGQDAISAVIVSNDQSLRTVLVTTGENDTAIVIQVSASAYANVQILVHAASPCDFTPPFGISGFYGGTLNAANFTFTATHLYLSLYETFGNMRWSAATTSGVRRFYTTDSVENYSEVASCEDMTVVENESVLTALDQICFKNSKLVLSPTWAQSTAASAFSDALEDHDMMAVLKLTQPVVFSVSGPAMRSQYGENALYSDDGVISAVYRSDATDAAQRLIDALLSLGANI